MHVDMDSFFAACEERERPDLVEKPVIVCVYSGRGEDGGAVSTANYEARKSGVHSGMPISKAKSMCPRGVFLPVNHELYTRISDKIMSIFTGYADVLEQVSIDEAFLDVSTRAGSLDGAKGLVTKLKKEITKKLGLTCSIGIGPNKLISKMASDIKKPDGLTIVEPQDVQDFLSPLEPRKLWGVGEKTSEKLSEMGIRSLGELANQSGELLVETFGISKGRWLKEASQGIDDEPVEKREKSEQVGRMATLPRDTRNKEAIIGAFQRLINDVYKSLDERGDYFRTLTITVVTKDLKTLTRSKTLETYTRHILVMQELADELISSYLRENPGILLRRVGVRVSNLSKKGGQKTLSDF